MTAPRYSPSVALELAAFVNGGLSLLALVIPIPQFALWLFAEGLHPDYVLGFVALSLGVYLGIGYGWSIAKESPHPRGFWVLSALYNVGALVFWTREASWDLGALHPALVLWVLYMLALSVWEAWRDRAAPLAEPAVSE